MKICLHRQIRSHIQKRFKAWNRGWGGGDVRLKNLVRRFLSSKQKVPVEPLLDWKVSPRDNLTVFRTSDFILQRFLQRSLNNPVLFFKMVLKLARYSPICFASLVDSNLYGVIATPQSETAGAHVKERKWRWWVKFTRNHWCHLVWLQWVYAVNM